MPVTGLVRCVHAGLRAWRPFLACRLLRRVFPFAGLGVHLLQRDVGIIGQPIARITMQEIFESLPRLGGIVEIVFIDLADGEQGVEPVSAAGILLAQEVVLFDGAAQNLVVVKAPAHLDHQLGRRHHARVRLRRRWGTEVDAPVRIDYALIFAASALARGAAVESLPHALRFGELLTSPRIVVQNARRGAHHRQQNEQQRCAKANGAAASS